MPLKLAILQKHWKRTAFGLALAACSALLLTLAFPPYGLWPLVWIGFLPELLAQSRVLPARLSSLAPAIAIDGWLGAFMIPIFIDIGTYMRWLSLVIGGIVLLVGSGGRYFHKRTGDDEVALAVAAILEQEFGGYRPPPIM